MYKTIYLFCVVLLSFFSIPCFSAQAVDLKHQPFSVLRSFQSQNAVPDNPSNIQEVSREVDFNQTTHIRIQQYYANHLVWGSDSVIHVPQQAKPSLITMNGLLYQKLTTDLSSTPTYVFSAAQIEKANQFVVEFYQKKTGEKNPPDEIKNQLIVYIDNNNKAHWAYLITYSTRNNTQLALPTYIIDAVTFEVYQQWNNLQTLEQKEGGGFGGNKKIGKVTYDGLSQDLPKLTISYDSKKKQCFLQNNDVTVVDARHQNAVIEFDCQQPDSTHNQVYWDGDLDTTHDAYSPANDALFSGKIIKSMYNDWYKIPVLTKRNQPMMLMMRVHENLDNAYWDGKQMTFGDGINYFYPLVSLDIAAHEISHGFTQQHANLNYLNQSGALNESFSDMAAQAAEFYAYGKSSWQIGQKITKAKGTALRYMDEPTKDCNRLSQPGNGCSISQMKNYSDGLDVHYGSGIYNKVFYLIATARNWDTRKAFNIMVQANRHYWTATTQFAEAACGVLKATRDYKYDVSAVINALKTVGISVAQC